MSDVQKKINKCPVCNSYLTIRSYLCPQCETEINGQFSSCIFCKLEPRHFELAKIFIKYDGSIKDLERELGVSYPTVKSKVEDLKIALGLLPEHREEKISFKGVTLKISQTDICSLQVDALVNSANSSLKMGYSGVEGSIHRRGGHSIIEEAQNLAPVNTGDAVITSGGKLKAKYVIHAVAVNNEEKTSADLISQATASALRKAEEQKLKSLAFPAFGTGTGGLDAVDSAKAMISTILDYIDKKENSLTEIIFAVYGEKFKVFEKVLKQSVEAYSEKVLLKA